MSAATAPGSRPSAQLAQCWSAAHHQNGDYPRPAAGAQGGADGNDRRRPATPRRIPIALSAFLIEHPQARVLVDPGVCIDAEQRAVAQVPAALRVAVRPPRDVLPTTRALAELPDAPVVDFALPTHLHWDHICGLLDMPDLPVSLHQPELSWVTTGPIAPVGGVRDALQHRPISTYILDGPPVATFERSHDLFGDGAVTLVDLAGHTPGKHRDSGAAPTQDGFCWQATPLGTVRRSRRSDRKRATPARSPTKTATCVSVRCTDFMRPVHTCGSFRRMTPWRAKPWRTTTFLRSSGNVDEDRRACP